MASRTPLRRRAAVALGVAACGVSTLGFVGLPLGRDPQRVPEVAGAPASQARVASQTWGPTPSSAFTFSSLALVGACLLRAKKAPVRGSRSVAVKAEAEAEAPVEKASTPPPPPEFDPSKQVGATLPLMYFDPAGFCKVGDRETFYNYRCAELKHGRVAMMAALGCVIQHWIKFPGFNEVPSGIKAVITPPGTFGLAALFVASGALEFTLFKQDPEKEPGDFGDPLGVGQYYDEWRNRELNNGRMAMIAILAITFTELVTGKDGVDQIFTPLSNLEVE